MQSRKGSFAESCISTAVGFIVTLLVQLIVFPIYHIQLNAVQNLQIVAIFTVVSIARQYFLRRIFNNITVKRMIKNA